MEKTVNMSEFVFIKGGTFMMGSPESEVSRYADEVQHQVTVSSFYMGKYVVTQKEYQEVEEYQEVTEENINPIAEYVLYLHKKYEKVFGAPSYFKGDSLPVVCLNWYDAVEYSNKRSIKEGLTPAYTIDKSRRDPNNRNYFDGFKYKVTWNREANGYRLPTEAEWEYACRAGTTTPFNTGDNITTDQANYNGDYPYNNNAKGIYMDKTTPVGSFAPNQFGLYDMHGNVLEWCWDWYGSYELTAQYNPSGHDASAMRVRRGGSWGFHAKDLRSAFRGNGNPDDQYSYISFRVVRSY